MRLAPAVLCAALLPGCMATGPTYEAAEQSRFIAANHRAADQIAGGWKPADARAPLLVATVVDIDNLQNSSTLGRVVAEQVAGRLAVRGLTVIELKLRNQLYVSASQGELLLSRETKDIARQHQAHAVVVGTYADAGEFVYVSIKLIDVERNKVLAATDYALPSLPTVRKMLTTAPAKR